jgi:hypothetical protein
LFDVLGGVVGAILVDEAAESALADNLRCDARQQGAVPKHANQIGSLLQTVGSVRCVTAEAFPRVQGRCAALQNVAAAGWVVLLSGAIMMLQRATRKPGRSGRQRAVDVGRSISANPSLFGYSYSSAPCTGSHVAALLEAGSYALSLEDARRATREFIRTR